MNEEKNELLKNLDKLHATELGIMRVKRNLSLDIGNVVEWCKDKINADNSIVTRIGKIPYIEKAGDNV